MNAGRMRADPGPVTLKHATRVDDRVATVEALGKSVALVLQSGGACAALLLPPESAHQLAAQLIACATVAEEFIGWADVVREAEARARHAS